MTILPLVSIIVLNYNGKKYIEQCIESILNSVYRNFELIIIDNNSTDDSIKTVESKFKDERIKVILNKKNLGFAGGNNLGVEYAKGKYLALINIDTIVDSKWLSEVISVMEADATIAVAQPKLMSLDDKLIFDSAGDYLDFFGNSFRRGGDWLEEDHGQYDNLHDIFSARGAALITRKEIVDRIGLFDEDYFLDFEDVDFCWRARLNGKRVVFVPTSIIYHKGAGISSQDSKIKGIHPSKNIVMTLVKNYGRYHMIRYAIIPHSIAFLTGFFMLEPFFFKKSNKRIYIRTRFQSFLWLLHNAKKMQAKRRHIQHNIRKVSDSEIMKYMVKTSRWRLTMFLIDYLRFGPTKAKMLYFNKGYQRVEPSSR